MQPTVPSPECVGCIVFALKKRAPSDEQRTHPRLVAMDREVVRRSLARILALAASLGALAALALAGGASFSGL